MRYTQDRVHTEGGKNVKAVRLYVALHGGGVGVAELRLYIAGVLGQHVVVQIRGPTRAGARLVSHTEQQNGGYLGVTSSRTWSLST